MNTNKKKWILTLDSREAAANLYSIFMAFQQTKGGGILNREAVRYITQWLKTIRKQIPDIDQLVNDTHGPFRQRDISPVMASLRLDSRERNLMLLICKMMDEQLATPETRLKWIINQGLADYEITVKNYKTWLAVLEDENAPQV